MKRIRVLVIGCGHMGAAHARAYKAITEFELVGLVSRGGDSRASLSQELGGTQDGQSIPQFENILEAIQATRPDAVSINTYPDTHVPIARLALENGAHVFVEKPFGTQLSDAQSVLDLARRLHLQVVVGYLLQHHPVYQRWIERAHGLGNPLVMRMSLNQQSFGLVWEKHLQLLKIGSPLVDCGVHYLDLMSAAAKSPAISLHAIGACLVEGSQAGLMNYGQIQVRFANGSIGWFESGWGPMVSQMAPAIRDIWGPKGSISLSQSQPPLRHQLVQHSAELKDSGPFRHPDQVVEWPDEPNHSELCRLEQHFFLRAIQEALDLTEHHQRAIHALQCVLAAEQSLRTGLPVSLTHP
jgi:predicted dehydrogenase